MFDFVHPCGQRVYLVDTPGFDDTKLSDTEVLKMVAGYLSSLYQKHVQLSGIIYLHRVTDVRLSGSALKNLNMFKKLCGEAFYRNVVLVTTMWSNLSGPGLSRETGECREHELVNREEWWGLMKSRGSQVLRHEAGDRDSALSIVEYLIRNTRPATLKVQRELIDEQKSLLNTSAGQEVNKELHEASKRWSEELKDMRGEYLQAMKDKDQKLSKLLLAQRESTERQIANAKQGQQELQISVQRLLAESEAKYAAKLRQVEAEFQSQLQAQRKEAKEASDAKDAEMVARERQRREERAVEQQRNEERDRQRDRQRNQQLEWERKKHADEMEQERQRQGERQEETQRQLSQISLRQSGTPSPSTPPIYQSLSPSPSPPWSLSPSPPRSLSPSPPRSRSPPLVYDDDESRGGRQRVGNNMALPLVATLAGATFDPLGLLAGGIFGLILLDR